ncbi:dATP/dGTP pyrophosphohydrolase domain-containing protein [Candidimonas nitroreducens]|uniref:dATP/dGTP pyrophosphohydrolase domain-containing protein n=1 Tax=Candidimonas nitroreducens TaxID=683354 RepID=UPI001E3A0876|nr:dATP/dGTP pyrophosphohydrolase domain-containing protein [Candidimonas nitroreducens]
MNDDIKLPPLPGGDYSNLSDHLPIVWGRAKLEAFARAAVELDRQQRGEAVVFNFADHLQRQREWSERTFGPGARAAGVVDHIRKELREIEADPGDLREWVDVIILALDGAWRSGASPEQIIETIVAKQSKNEGRAWPDWRTMDPNKAIEHDRSQDTVPQPAEPVVNQSLTGNEPAGFEVWADDQGFPLQRTVRGDDYQDLRTQGAWDSWQARAAFAKPLNILKKMHSDSHEIPKEYKDSIEATVGYVDGWNHCRETIQSLQVAEPVKDEPSDGHDRMLREILAYFKAWQPGAYMGSFRAGDAAAAISDVLGRHQGAQPPRDASVTLSGAQLLDALDFVAPDRITDPEQLESEATIQHGDGHSGRGYYCAFADYPEEGSIFLDGTFGAAQPVLEGAPTPPADGHFDTQAIRDVALEEAARQCEDIYSWRGAYSAGVMSTNTLDTCAAAIRALKSRPACQTCGGSGWIGGPSYYQPDEGGEPCPDCAQGREGAEQMVPYASAKHWHDLYRAECRKRQDDAAGYGSQIQDFEADAERLDAFDRMAREDNECLPMIDNGNWVVARLENGVGGFGGGVAYDRYPSFRAAIDAARAAKERT